MVTRSASPTRHPMPFVRIEIAVMAVADGALRVLLGQRAEEPFAGQWALPGGVLRIDLDEDLDAACRRVMTERLGHEFPGATQLCAVGARDRDPRAPWALSVVYRCMVLADALAPMPGKRLEALRWADAPAAAGDPALAFDHRHLIGMTLQRLRSDVEALGFPPGLLAEPFTLGELQAACETVLGRALDKSSFRRKLDASGVVEAAPGQMRTGAFRPAQLYALTAPRS